MLLDLGRCVGILHQADIVHGDLTTSNAIWVEGTADETGHVVMLDFGLTQVQSAVSIEEKGVDLYVLERALTSTHAGTDDDWVCDAVNEWHSTIVTSMHIIHAALCCASHLGRPDDDCIGGIPASVP